MNDAEDMTEDIDLEFVDNYDDDDALLALAAELENDESDLAGAEDDGSKLIAKPPQEDTSAPSDFAAQLLAVQKKHAEQRKVKEAEKTTSFKKGQDFTPGIEATKKKKTVPTIVGDAVDAEGKERFSGFRIKPGSLKVSKFEMEDCMMDRRTVLLRNISTEMRDDEIAGDWVTFGVISSRSLPKETSTKSSKFLSWKLTDLRGNFMSMFLFDDAYHVLWKEREGLAVAILNPTILPSRGDDKRGISLSVKESTKVLILGQAQDLGVCRSKRKDGTPCTMTVNLKLSEYCEFHIQTEFKKLNSKRVVLNGTVTRPMLKPQAQIPHHNNFSVGVFNPGVGARSVNSLGVATKRREKEDVRASVANLISNSKSEMVTKSKAGVGNLKATLKLSESLPMKRQAQTDAIIGATSDEKRARSGGEVAGKIAANLPDAKPTATMLKARQMQQAREREKEKQTEKGSGETKEDSGEREKRKGRNEAHSEGAMMTSGDNFNGTNIDDPIGSENISEKSTAKRQRLSEKEILPSGLGGDSISLDVDDDLDLTVQTKSKKETSDRKSDRAEEGSLRAGADKSAESLAENQRRKSGGEASRKSEESKLEKTSVVPSKNNIVKKSSGRRTMEIDGEIFSEWNARVDLAVFADFVEDAESVCRFRGAVWRKGRVSGWKLKQIPRASSEIPTEKSDLKNLRNTSRPADATGGSDAEKLKLLRSTPLPRPSSAPTTSSEPIRNRTPTKPGLSDEALRKRAALIEQLKSRDPAAECVKNKISAEKAVATEKLAKIILEKKRKENIVMDIGDARREAEQQTRGKNLANMFGITLETDKLLAIKSSHENLVDEKREARAERESFLNAKKEEMLFSMENIQETMVMAYRCSQCHITSLGMPGCATSKGHAPDRIKSLKRFFECGNCRRRTFTLDSKMVNVPCESCGARSFNRVGMASVPVAPLPSDGFVVRGLYTDN